MNGAPPDLVVFDLDDTLVDFHPALRLAHLARLTGFAPERIHAAIWGSEFERAAEAGAYQTGAEYLDAFNRRLGFALTRTQWIAARAAAMRPRPYMLEIVRCVRERVPVALLTNNGPLLRECLPDLVPEICALIPERRHASSDFHARKPDPAVFARLLARYAVAPDRALFIDDDAEYVAGAVTAGMQTIRYQSALQIRSALVTAKLLPTEDTG